VRVLALLAREQAIAAPAELELFVTSPVGLAELPPAGSRIEASGELVPDAERPLRFGYVRVKSLLLVRPAGTGMLVDRARQALTQALVRAAGSDLARQRSAALAAALVLGRTEALSAGELVTLRNSGLVHILSVSGLHVGVVAVLVWTALNLVGVRPRARRWAITVAVLVFAVLAGGYAPVRRASAGAVALVLARQLGRPLSLVPATWAIVGGLLLWEPRAVLEPGFQLSAGITLALVCWTGSLARSLSILPRRLAQAFAVTIVAQLAALPVIGQYFVGVPVLGVVANVLAAPLALPLVLVSGMAVALAPLAGALAGLMLTVLAGGQWLLRELAAFGAWGRTGFAPLPPSGWLVAGGLALAGLTRVRTARLAALAWVVGTLAWWLAPAMPRGTTCELRPLDVRDGMALLLRSGGQAVLFDAGRGRSDAWRALAAQRIRRLSALVITHPDEDHTGGAVALVENLAIERLIVGGVTADRPEIVTLLRAARERGCAELLVGRGTALNLPDLTLEFVWPPGDSMLRDNDLSLVTRVHAGGLGILVTGDLEVEGENALLESGANVQAEILQLGHHGSRTSSSAALLGAVGPTVTVAPTGIRPRFAYPHREVRERVRALPALVLDHRLEPLWLAWDEGDHVTVGMRQPVRVHLATRGHR
jgi:competence protein ComEC